MTSKVKEHIVQEMRTICFNDGWRVRSTEGPEIDKEITLPFDATIHAPRTPKATSGSKKGYFPNGTYVFTKSFTIDYQNKESKCFLEFDGVYANAKVFINGRLCEEHTYGYTPFILNISEFVRQNQGNEIAVECSSKDDSRWYSGTGIYRDVWLHYANEAHIPFDGIHVKTCEANAETALLEVSVSMPKTTQIRHEIWNEGQIIAQFKGVDARIRIHRPKLWNAERPHRYRLHTTVLDGTAILDERDTLFGIRTVSMKPGVGLFVNGERTLLRGACIHHDNGLLGAASFRAAERRKLEALKDVGFNAVRIAHHPAGRHTLDLCDELGLYVVNETFDMWHRHKSEDDYACHFDKCQGEDVRAMVESSFNHPCVLFYSLGNEIPDLAYPDGLETLAMLAKEVRALDPTRLLTTAISGYMLVNEERAQRGLGVAGDINLFATHFHEQLQSAHQSATVTDFLDQIEPLVDVLGYNYMSERYESDERERPLRLILGTESYPFDGPKIYSYMREHSNVIGDFLWVGFDYLGESGIGNSSYEAPSPTGWVYGEYPCVSGNCADVSITYDRLPASYLHQIAMGQRSEPYIAVYNPCHFGQRPFYSLWGFYDVLPAWEYPDHEGQPIEVDVYSSSRSVTLYLNGERLATDEVRDNIASFVLNYESGTLKAVDSKGNEYELVTPSQDVTLHMRAVWDELLFVSLALEDNQGHRHYREDGSIQLSIEGADLLGFGNGDPNTEEAFDEFSHCTYHGAALAILRPMSTIVRIIARYGDQRIERTYIAPKNNG